MKVTVDRFEGGIACSCVWPDETQQILVPRELLPGVDEGDVLERDGSEGRRRDTGGAGACLVDDRSAQGRRRKPRRHDPSHVRSNSDPDSRRNSSTWATLM